MTTNAANEFQPRNPFPESDADRHEIWNVVVRRDFEAFVAGDWLMVQPDFWDEGFCGVDARKEPEPSQWRLTFPTVTSYRDEWLRQAREFAPMRLVGTTNLQFLYDACCMKSIEINGEHAIGLKTFDGAAKTCDGRDVILCFQSLYKLVRRGNRWLIAGFVGYLPNPMPLNSTVAVKPHETSTNSFTL